MSDAGDTLGDAYINVFANTETLGEGLDEAKQMTQSALSNISGAVPVMDTSNLIGVAADVAQGTVAIRQLNKELFGLTRTLTFAQNIGSGSVRGMLQGARGLGALLGPETLAVAAFSAAMYAAWKLGEKMGVGIGNALQPIDTALIKITNRFKAMRAEMKVVDEVEMKKLEKTLERISNIMSPDIAQFGRETRRRTSVIGSQSGARTAEIEATYSEGHEKTLALANERYIAAMAQAKAEKDLAVDTIQAAKDQQAHAEAELEKLRQDVRTADAGWAKKAAEERLETARPKIAAIIDAAQQEILDMTARISSVEAGKMSALWDANAARIRAVDQQNAIAKEKADLTSGLEAAKAKVMAESEQRSTGGMLSSAQDISHTAQAGVFQAQARQTAALEKIVELEKENAKSLAKIAANESPDIAP